MAIDLTDSSVEIGGLAGEVLFAGLTPGFVGLYQLNILLPVGLPPSGMNGPQEVNGKLKIGGTEYELLLYLN